VAPAARRVILFTGFPGFIGERLLPRLVELVPEPSFACLVQERFLETARQRIRAIEERHPHARGRIATVVGDITEDRLGLDPATARRLQDGITGAWHLAAAYDLAISREVGQRVNVDGTRRVVELLSGARRLDRLHYVSTAYVSGAATGVFRETDLDVGQSFKNHYEETKFLAEAEVVRSGLPATVYRPAIVVGDSRTGETAKFDGPYFTMAAMEKAPSPGLFVRIGSGRNPANMVPVDFVVEAMARLGALADGRGRTYHLTDPEPLSTLEVARLFARALGKRFAFVPVPKAVARALLAPGPVRRYFGMPLETLDYFDHPCTYDAAQATAALELLGISCPRLPEYVDRLVTFYRAQAGRLRREAMV
jgi:thioester reductase-like protein